MKLKELENSGVGVCLYGNLFTESTMYADNFALTVSQLQRMLDIVFAYFRKWRYNLNADKSVILVFGARLSSPSCWSLGSDPVAIACVPAFSSGSTDGSAKVTSGVLFQDLLTISQLVE